MFSVGTFLLFQFSCEVDPLNDPRETFWYGDVTVKTNAGMLQFENRADFQEVMEGIIEKRHDPENDGVHFRSMQRIINEIPADTLEIMDETLVTKRYSSIFTIVQEGEDKYLRPVVDSRALRSLVNHEGNLAIGDTIYQFTYDKTYALAKDRFTTSESIQKNADQAFNVVRRSGSNSDDLEFVDCIDHYGGEGNKQQRKMKGEVWDYNNAIYREVSVRIENFDKNFALIWKKEDATNIWLEGHVKVEYNDSDLGLVTLEVDLNEHETQQSDIAVVVLSRYFDNINFGNLKWAGTDMTFKTDESDDSEVSVDFDSAQCTIVE